MAGITYINSRSVQANGNTFTNCDTAMELYGCTEASIDELTVITRGSRSKHRTKVGRNQLCPCGSGIKYKRCNCFRGETMSTGIRAEGSSFTVGKAKIIADVGVDMVNSTGHVDDYEFYDVKAPDLAKLLRDLPERPPVELVSEAVEQVRSGNKAEDLETSRLRKWCKDQGINAAFWAQLAVAIVSAAASFK